MNRVKGNCGKRLKTRRESVLDRFLETAFFEFTSSKYAAFLKFLASNHASGFYN